MKYWRKLTAILLAFAIFLTACGGAGSDNGTSAAETESAAESQGALISEKQESGEENVSEAANEAQEENAEEGKSEDTASSTPATAAEANAAAGKEATNADLSEAPEIPGLTAESVLPLRYATCFNVFYYSDGYKLIDVPTSAQYLLIPEGKEAPEGLDENIVQIQEPIESIYLAATSAMALFDAIDSIDKVTMSGTSEGGWYIDAPNEALESGAMVYAGKYSEPDYETMIAKDCDLAIESTMILHTPEVQEMIEGIGIPVFIDRSAYETGPLGRTEWVKLYGVMMNKDDDANAFFAEQQKIIDALEDFPNTGKTVAYFSVNTDGSVVVRTNNDYIPAMIDLAGGVYAFDGMFPNVTSSTSSISMEQFYATALDADYLVYNATIEEALGSIEDLVAKDEVFKDFKAVEEGNVWQVDKTAYQSTDKLANLILDFNIMITDGDESQLMFLKKLDK
ncbi:MAG: ABC transporter substrate-binding protein [Lachnospiraceae bacterium]|nr:ABC transporter substrate-binding protein [Lachnospiraceae bacterium]